MRIIEPSVELVNPSTYHEGVQMLRDIERLARISHRSEERQAPDTWRPFLTAVVLGHGDWSVTEHRHATAIFRVNRGVTHELVRHRLFSFTQESTRFVNPVKFYHEGGLEFIPSKIAPENNIQANTFLALEKSYTEMLEHGARPQEARAVLPNALAATIAVTGNLRAWRHLLVMRTTKETHPDFKAVTVPLLKTFQECVPLLFDDITPEERQLDAMRRPR